MCRVPHAYWITLYALLGLVAAPGHGQNPIWSEEFDGPAIDSDIWTYDVGGSGFGNQELQLVNTGGIKGDVWGEGITNVAGKVSPFPGVNLSRDEPVSGG